MCSQYKVPVSAEESNHPLAACTASRLQASEGVFGNFCRTGEEKG